MNIQNEILQTLKTRLETITIANAYPITIKKVNTGKGVLTMKLDPSQLPFVDIVNGGLETDKAYMGQINKFRMPITLRLVLKKEATDADLIQFQSCVLRAVFNNSYDVINGQKDGMKLNNGTQDLISYIELEAIHPDYNLIEANRMTDINLNLYFSSKIIDL